MRVFAAKGAWNKEMVLSFFLAERRHFEELAEVASILGADLDFECIGRYFSICGGFNFEVATA